MLPTLLEPNATTDRSVHNASSLVQELEAASLEERPVSLRIVGDISLASLPASAMGTLLNIPATASVTLWAEDDARLDAASTGRHFLINGKLLIQRLAIVNGFATSNGGCLRTSGASAYVSMRGGRLESCVSTTNGGGLAMLGGTIAFEGTTFDACEVQRTEAGNAMGGAIFIQAGELSVVDVTFAAAHAHAALGSALGGAVALWGGGQVWMERVLFTRCVATSTGLHAQASFGGAIGTNSGQVTIINGTFVGTSAAITGSAAATAARAFGGAIGVNAVRAP